MVGRQIRGGIGGVILVFVIVANGTARYGDIDGTLVVRTGQHGCPGIGFSSGVIAY